MERRIREARAGFDAGQRAARRTRSSPPALDTDLDEDQDVIL
jgi:hypothetical protein